MMKERTKNIIAIIIMTLFALWLIGCDSGGTDGKSTVPTNVTATGTSLEVWKRLKGSFTRQGSGQYDNATLQMKYLDNSCVVFEFDLMEGDESQEFARDVVLPFVMLIGDDGVGRYESDPDAKNPLTISVALSADGLQATVTHEGDMPISCDGVYDYVDDGLEVSKYSAAAILDFLPTVATSLNSNNGAYTLQYGEEFIANWFYPVEATFNDSGVTLAKFIIAKDMSAVFRVDDDIEPVLIYGSAQPMLDYVTTIWPEADEDVAEEPYNANLVSVRLDKGVLLKLGDRAKLIADMPWDFQWSTNAYSDEIVLHVDPETKTVTAIGEGKANITGKLFVEDGQVEFQIEVTVGKEGLSIDAIMEN